jgi:hypothetical protein
MKLTKTMSLPRSSKIMIALTPKSKRQGNGDMPKTAEGVAQPGLPSLTKIFVAAQIAETNAKNQARKSSKDDKKDGTKSADK